MSERVEPTAVATSPTPASAPCPRCGTPRTGRDRYCEQCGFDHLAAPAWSIRVTVDPEYFARLGPQDLSLPAAPASERMVTLDNSPLRIGRGADLDLGGDPAISRLHASLVRADGGGWAIVDEGSSNGTTLNDDPRALDPHVLVALHDGDRIRLGAWTTLVVSAGG
jgi:hypothetical protein